MHPTGGSRRVFEQFAWLGVGSGKVASSHPAHQRVTPTVSLLFAYFMKPYLNDLIILKIVTVGFVMTLVGCSPQIENSPIPTAIIETKSVPSPIPAAKLENTECASPETTMPAPNLPESYIGKTFDTLQLPEGLEFIFGSLIKTSDFTLVQIAVSSRNMQILWLAEIKCKKHYVHDVLVLPALNSNEMLVTDYCRINGEEDAEILAVGEYDPGLIPLQTIDYAWRANRETKKFEELSSDGIECWRDIGIISP